MGRKRKGGDAAYQEYRAASGWYLAAWRDHRGLTLEELAEAVGTSKGYVSDLETGAARADRPIRRFNRDMVDNMARALGTTGGRLIDVNPFDLDEEQDQFNVNLRQMSPEDRQQILALAARLVKQGG